MKKFLIGFALAILTLIVMALAGQFGRDLAKKTMASKEDIEINSISDQYADASKKMTVALTEFLQAEQEIKGSVEELKSLKELLTESKTAFELHEEIREKGYNYLMENKNAFEKELYDDMLFSFGEESIRLCNQAFIEFSLKYIEAIDYSILNFDKIVSSKEPEITFYNEKLNSSANLKQKYNEAYLKKMHDFKNRFGETALIRAKEKLRE